VRVEFEKAQHQGSRKEQQDAYGIYEMNELSSHYGLLAVLADGMGGMAMGKECAEKAVTSFFNSYCKKSEDEAIPEALERSINECNKSVYDMSDSVGLGQEAGSTLVASVIYKRFLYWVSVGDSHIYLYRNNILKQVNKDHNLRTRLESLAASGQISLSDIDNGHNPEALTSYIGIKDLSEIDLSDSPLFLRSGDIVLLCSDGLYKTIDESQITEILSSNIKGMADELINNVMEKKNPYQDNITVLLLKFKGEPETILVKNTHKKNEIGIKDKTKNNILTNIFKKITKNQ